MKTKPRDSHSGCPAVFLASGDSPHEGIEHDRGLAPGGGAVGIQAAGAVPPNHAQPLGQGGVSQQSVGNVGLVGEGSVVDPLEPRRRP